MASRLSTMTRGLALVPAALAGLALAISCAEDPLVPVDNDDDDGGDTGSGVVCIPDADIPCICDMGLIGAQLCAPDGMSMGPCICPEGGTGGEEAGSDSGDSTGGDGLCGNGEVDEEEGEQCDDANSVHDDACSNDCILECGQHWEVVIDPEDTGSFGFDVAVGPSGEVVVVGVLETADKGDDVWITKLDAEGEVLWETTYDHAEGNDGAEAVSIDADGNIVVVSTVRTGAGDDDIRVAYYDPDGNEQWSDDIDGAKAGDDIGRGSTFDARGNVYVSGTIRNADGDTDLWVRKYAPAGTETWTTTHTAPGNGTYSLDIAGDVAVDADGNVYSMIEAYVDFETRDVGLVKFGPDGGDALWEVQPQMGGPAHTHRAGGLAVDGNGDIVWAINVDTVSSSWTFWVYKHDADGNELWVADVDDIGIGSRHFLEAIGVGDAGQIGMMLTSDPSDGDLEAVVATLDSDGVAGCNGAVGLDLGAIVPAGGFVDANGNVYGTGLTTISPGTQRRWISRFRGAALTR